MYISDEFYAEIICTKLEAFIIVFQSKIVVHAVSIVKKKKIGGKSPLLLKKRGDFQKDGSTF